MLMKRAPNAAAVFVLAVVMVAPSVCPGLASAAPKSMSGEKVSLAADAPPAAPVAAAQDRSDTRASLPYATDPDSTWHVLVLIFRNTDTDYVDSAGVTRHLTAELPQSDIDALVQSFNGSLSAAVRQWSQNQAAWDVEIQYPSQPVDRVSDPWGADNAQWLDSSCISQAMEAYYQEGYHDDVMVYWRSSDDAGDRIPDPGWGLALSNYGSNHYGYITVTYPGWTVWDPLVADGPCQVWIHEWIHTVSWFYGDLGYRLPVDDADGAGSHGYTYDQPPFPGWGTYYADLMNDRVLEDGVLTGVPAEAWGRATIRDTVDEMAPTTTATAAGGIWHGRTVTVTFSATDAGSPSSGVYSTEYRLDGGAWQSGTSIGFRMSIRHKRGGYSRGDHVIEYRSTDNAGNTETTRSCVVKIG